MNEKLSFAQKARINAIEAMAAERARMAAKLAHDEEVRAAAKARGIFARLRAFFF